MNALHVCPHCDGAISRASRACPSCGAVTVRGRDLARRSHDAAPQSVFLMVLDAFRPRVDGGRSGARQLREVVRDG
jgi:hypothetical protein